MKINNNPKVIINKKICAKQGSNLRSLRNFLLREASYDHSTIRAKHEKIYCSLRGSNPRPWAHKTQILTAELKEHHNHTIFGLIFICFSFYNFYLVLVLVLFYYRINDCVHKIICESVSVSVSVIVIVNNITTL
jgi:hypothetical protein